MCQPGAPLTYAVRRIVSRYPRGFDSLWRKPSSARLSVSEVCREAWSAISLSMPLGGYPSTTRLADELFLDSAHGLGDHDAALAAEHTLAACTPNRWRRSRRWGRSGYNCAQSLLIETLENSGDRLGASYSSHPVSSSGFRLITGLMCQYEIRPGCTPPRAAVPPPIPAPSNDQLPQSKRRDAWSSSPWTLTSVVMLTT